MMPGQTLRFVVLEDRTVQCSLLMKETESKYYKYPLQASAHDSRSVSRTIPKRITTNEDFGRVGRGRLSAV